MGDEEKRLLSITPQQIEESTSISNSIQIGNNDLTTNTLLIGIDMFNPDTGNLEYDINKIINFYDYNVSNEVIVNKEYYGMDDYIHNGNHKFKLIKKINNLQKVPSNYLKSIIRDELRKIEDFKKDANKGNYDQVKNWFKDNFISTSDELNETDVSNENSINKIYNYMTLTKNDVNIYRKKRILLFPGQEYKMTQTDSNLLSKNTKPKLDSSRYPDLESKLVRYELKNKNIISTYVFVSKNSANDQKFDLSKITEPIRNLNHSAENYNRQEAISIIDDLYVQASYTLISTIVGDPNHSNHNRSNNRQLDDINDSIQTEIDNYKLFLENLNKMDIKKK